MQRVGSASGGDGSEPITAGAPDRDSTGRVTHNRQTRPPPPPVVMGRLPKLGAMLGQYEIIRELGRGGMGAVFLARDTKLGRRVAIKFLLSDKPELNVRFILEARATAQFQHENIIVIHEVDEYEDHPFMVLEYLQGSPLSTLLEQGRRLTSRRAVDIMLAVARALERAHAHNIVHRDLKPDNIFLTHSGTIKVLDFGIAKLMQVHEPQVTGRSPTAMASLLEDLTADAGRSQTGSSQLTQRGAIMGTLPYMSPEQWGAGAVDYRSDLWACGILLFRMVAGRHPLAPRKGAQLVITAMLDQPMPLARQACPEIPDELARIIDRCLLKHKDQRMGSAREFIDALQEFAPGQHTRVIRADETPYAGLSSFQESDAARFFGRGKEIAAAVARLGKQPLFGVVGASGVGKSSFVRAGIAPALKQSGEPWSTLLVRPGRTPVSALAQAISPMVTKTTTTTVSADLAELHAIHQRLYDEPGYLGVVLRSRARHSRQRILLFVDQFEELYTLVQDPRERLAFTRCLSSAADDPTSPLRVVISIRSDYLDRVSEDQHFMTELSQGLFFLTSPGRAGLRDALIQPAEMAGFQFETEDMVEHMLDHLEHTPGALPLLQFAATKLWELRDTKTRLLTRQSYDRIGGISGALASHADSVLAELPPHSQVLARALLLRLITPERTRAIVSVNELYELSQTPQAVQSLLDHLVNARLIVVQTGDGSGAATAEIVHESLLHSWPVLRRWLDDNQEDAAFLQQLRDAARQWQAKGYALGLLWRGEAMEEAKLWYRRYRGELPQLQQRYLQHVFALADRAGRRKRIAVTGVVAFLGLLVAAAAVALIVIRDAERQARNAELELRHQMNEVRAARDAAEVERQKADQARSEAVAASEELSGKNRALVAAVSEAQQARRLADEARIRAEKSKRRARRDRRKAEAKEREAKEQEERASKANQELERVLEEERKRIKELEAQGTNHAISDIEVR